MSTAGNGGSGGPVATATATLLEWLSAAGVTPRIATPGTGDPAPGAVRVWPVAVLREQAVRGAGGPGPLRLRVRYLLSCDPPTDDATQLIDRILVASLAGGPVSLLIEPVAAEVWQAFGLYPRLGLCAEVATQATRPRPRSPRVRTGLRVDTQPLRQVRGQVVGPGAIPVPGIRVVVADTGTTSYTDNRGRFAFPALPAGRPARLLLSGKGVELVADIAAPTDEPVVIHCDLEEV
jgi:hypothetical protein